MNEVGSLKITFYNLNEKKYKVFTVFVTNPNIISNEAENVKDEMLDYDYDFVISNDGDILDLQKKADEFINNICCERTQEKCMS